MTTRRQGGTKLAQATGVDIARSSPGRRRRPLVAAGLGLALVAVAAVAWARTSPAPTSSVQRSSVFTETVKRGDLVREVPVQGSLVPEHVQWLSAVTAARVAEILVRPGAQVTSDTVVVRLENAELELAALEAERQAASAESALVQLDVKTSAEEKLQASNLTGLTSDLRDAERQARAAERLAPEGLMSDLDRNAALNKERGLLQRVVTETERHKVLEGGRDRQLAGQRAEVKRLHDIAAFRKKQLAALYVRAGIDGIVQDVPLENGQWVAIGTVLAKVAQPERLKADVKVAEGNAKDVHKGLAVRFETQSGVFRGTVARVDPSVIGGSVRLEVALAGELPPGARADQTVSGYVEIERLPGVLYVARPAGVQDDALSGLFRLTADKSEASRVMTKLGRGSAREIVVQSGLSEGDEIIISDTSTWDVKDRVRIK